MEFVIIVISTTLLAGIISFVKIFFTKKHIEKSKRCSVRVDAVVSYRKVEQVWGSDGVSNRCTIRCRYVYQGNTYTTQDMQVGFRHLRYKEGDPIELYVNPDDISEVMLRRANETQLGYGKIIFTILGAIGIVIIGFVMYIGFMINNMLAEKIDSKWIPKERTQITATPLATHIPDNYIKGQYCGIEISLPDNFSEAIYAGNDIKSGHCYFTSKKSAKPIFDIRVANNNTTKDKAMESLKNYVSRKDVSLKLWKEIESNDQFFEIYRVVANQNSGNTPDYDYYAISATEKKKIILTHYEDVEELYTIINSVKY